MSKSLEDIIAEPIQHEIDKHGHSCGCETVADYINSLDQFEFLQLISSALEERHRPKQEVK